MEETLVLVPGSSVGSSLPSSIYLDRCFPYWLGWGIGRPLSSGFVEESSSLLTHELPRDDGHLQCVEASPPRPEGPSCVALDRKHASINLI